MSCSKAIARRLPLFLFIASWVLPQSAIAQSGTAGRLAGVVQDSSGAVMPGVAVTARNVGTGLNRTVTSDGEGRWTIAALPVGSYQVTYEINGFKKLKQEGVAVEAAVARTIDAQLEVEAAPGEEVTVTENVLLVSPDTASTYRQISSQ